MSKEEKEVLYQSFIESGLSCSEFAKRNNVPVSILRGIISYKKRVSQGEQSGFINVCIDPNDKPISLSSSYRIEFVLDGHHFQIDELFLKAFLRSLL